MDKIQEELLSYIKELTENNKKAKVSYDINEIRRSLTSVNKNIERLHGYEDTMSQMKLKERIQENREDKLIISIIRILDSIDWLLNSSSDNGNESLLKSVEATKRMITRELQSIKLIATPEKGDFYNENYHICIGYKKEPGRPNNEVLEIVKKGYIYRDRILRPAEVIVVNNNEVEETYERNRD